MDDATGDDSKDDRASNVTDFIIKVTVCNLDTIPVQDMPVIILIEPPQGLIDKKKCRICHKKFQEEQHFKEHASQCKTIQCPYCSFKNTDESSFNTHWQTHQDKFKRNLRPVITTTEANVSFIINLSCPKCTEIFNSENHLFIHMLCCKKLYCTYCDFTTYKSFELKQHCQKEHLQPKDTSKTCSRCNKTFKNAHSLSTHSWICGKKPCYECHDCGYKTFNKYNLRFHILGKHMRSTTNKKSSNDLVKPEKVIGDDNLVTQKVCQICYKIFPCEPILLAHATRCREYNCTYCTYKTYVKAELNNHIEEHEQEERLRNSGIGNVNIKHEHC